MDVQVFVLAGGTSEKLSPLVSKDVPKALLPVANRPVLSYVLDLLETSDLKDIIVVVEGQEAARLVGAWVSSAYLDRLLVEMEIQSDLMDAHLYAFKRTTLQDVLEQKEAYRSIRLEVLPYLVRSQLRSAPSGGEGTTVDETGSGAVRPTVIYSVCRSIV